MAFGPILLRVLLSVSLILNGSGYALAAPSHSERGHVQTAAPTVAGAERVADAQPPCHQQEAAALPDAAASPPGTPHDDASNTTDPDADDCCKDGACRCGCVHQSQVALPAFLLRTPGLAPPHAVCGRQNRHAEPALLHLMRPPIV